MTTRRLHRYCARPPYAHLVLPVILSLFMILIVAVAQTGQTVFFYSSETNINNFSSLKVEFDTYLRKYGVFQFQPFSDRETFEQFASGDPAGVYLVSSWHYKSLREKIPIRPVLVGVSRGRSTQRRVLTSDAALGGLADLKGKTIASSGSELYTRDLLAEMLGDETLLKTVHILAVPKDIDALLAVGFKMADAALTTENSLVKLSGLNPVHHAALKVVATSEETLLPIVATREGSGATVEALLGFLEEMGIRHEGSQRLKMLGLDRWKRLGPVEERILNR